MTSLSPEKRYNFSHIGKLRDILGLGLHHRTALVRNDGGPLSLRAKSDALSPTLMATPHPPFSLPDVGLAVQQEIRARRESG